jgi:hypothetical protein
MNRPIVHPLAAEVAADPIEAPANAKPCWFCKGTRLWVWDKGVPGGFAICCSHPFCAATGPISMESIEHATLLWNTPEGRPQK